MTTVPSPWDTVKHFGEVPELTWTLSAPWAQVISTAIVGLIVAYIAWRQWKTASQKLALDLFEKRYAIYQTISDHYGSGLSPPTTTQEQKVARLLETQFLFGKDVSSKVVDILTTQPRSPEQRKAADDMLLNMRRYMQFHEPIAPPTKSFKLRWRNRYRMRKLRKRFANQIKSTPLK